VNLPPVLTPPPNATLDELTFYTNNATATDPDQPANTLLFALISGPSNLLVSASGGISWTPAEAQGPSTNDILIKVTDSNPTAVNATALSMTNTFRLIVSEVNVAPALTLPPTTNINEMTIYSANATASDSDLPTNSLVFSLVSGPSNLTVSATGLINWTPNEAQGPSNYVVQIKVTDTNPPAVNSTSLSTTNSYQITVNEVNLPPVLAAILDRMVNPGVLIQFTNSTTDPDLPTNTFTYSLLSPPPGAMVGSSSGVFTWRPPAALADTTNQIQVRVADNGVPSLTDTQSFSVVVNPTLPVVLTPVIYTNGLFRFEVSGTQGPDYVIQASDNLPIWIDVATNSSPNPPFQFDDATAGSSMDRTYRVRLSP
jgi:hypothetical protein